MNADDILYSPIGQPGTKRCERHGVDYADGEYCGQCVDRASDALAEMVMREAQRCKAALLTDPQWIRSYLAGDRDKLRAMTALSAIIAGCYAEWRDL